MCTSNTPEKKANMTFFFWKKEPEKETIMVLKRKKKEIWEKDHNGSKGNLLKNRL